MSHPRISPEWPEHKIDLLVALSDAGKSVSEMAQRLRVSVNAVVGKRSRLGLEKRPSPILPRLSDEERAKRGPRPERTDPLALLKRQATLPLPMPIPTAAPKQCQWALNDGRPWRFCNRPTVYHHRLDGSRYRSSWCADHIERVFACRAVEAAA